MNTKSCLVSAKVWYYMKAYVVTMGGGCGLSHQTQPQVHLEIRVPKRKTIRDSAEHGAAPAVGQWPRASLPSREAAAGCGRRSSRRTTEAAAAHLDAWVTEEEARRREQRRAEQEAMAATAV